MKAQNARDTLEMFLPFAVLLVLFLLGFSTLQPFLPASIWGVILAVAFLQMHTRLERLFWNKRSLATTVTIILLVVVIVVPIFFLSRAILAFMPDVIAWSESNNSLIDLSEFGMGAAADGPNGNDNILLNDLFRTIAYDIEKLRGFLGTEIRPFAFWLMKEGRLLGLFVLEFVLGLIVASIILHRHEKFRRVVEKSLTMLGGPFALHLGMTLVGTIRATVLGLLGAATAQALLASVAYYASGVPHWGILTALTFLLAFIQIGPLLIWIPICIWLWASDQIALAIFVGAWCGVIVGSADNVIKAYFVSRQSDLPGLLAFMGAVGGLLTWGIIGVFVGPVIVAVCYQLWLSWLASAKDPAVKIE